MAVDAKTETNVGQRLSFRFLRTVATDEDLCSATFERYQIW